MVRLGVPGFNIDSLSYADARMATVPVIQAPRRPTVNDKKYPVWCEWRVDKNATAPVTEGEFWKLIRFETSGDATWVQYEPGVGVAGVVDIRDQVNALVGPNISGYIDIDGSAVANGINPSGVPLETVADIVTSTLDVQIQVATGITGAPGDKNDAGICSFDDTAFAVNNDGYVTLIGGAGPTLDSVDVDFNTVPGTDPVVPDATGLINLLGNTVANATNANSPIATHSRSPHVINLDVQVGAAVAATPGDKYDTGLLSLDNRYFSVTAHGFGSWKEEMINMPAGTTVNLGIDYSSPTFTISSSSGAALSATNPAYVVLPSHLDGGKKIVHEITSDYTFDDDSGTSDLTGNTWGTTTTVAWAVEMPFFIYAAADTSDTNCRFFISRVPNRGGQQSPAAGFIAKSGSALASTPGSFFCLDNITVADYAAVPTCPIGSFEMQKNDAGNDDWTVYALISHDGIGLFKENRGFALPADQNGAVRYGLSSSVGGDTIPSFGGAFSLGYRLIGNTCTVSWNAANVSVSGVGTGMIRMHLPFATNTGAGNHIYSGEGMRKDSLAARYNSWYTHQTNSQSYFDWIRHGSAAQYIASQDIVTGGTWTDICCDVTFPISET